MLPLQLKTYQLHNTALELFVPYPRQMQLSYEESKETDFPYWSQVWPAAIALSEFIIENPVYVKDKKVLELGAGLGLPSFTAAKWAKDIYCTDYHAEAVAIIQKTMVHHQLQNMKAEQLHWQALPEKIMADTLLLSDVNYNPANFEALYDVIKYFLQSGTCILLSTPQRLLAKPFIERLLPWCVWQEEKEVAVKMIGINISIMVLQKIPNKVNDLTNQQSDLII
jgi:predicted nicotinamide N-methyase